MRKTHTGEGLVEHAVAVGGHALGVVLRLVWPVPQHL
jgi:hypothetical protein